MFTKIATGILWFFIIVGILFSLIAGGGACSQDGSFWWIAPVGIIATLLIATGMGVVVELANNVAKCKKYLKILAGDTSADPDEPSVIGNANNTLQKNDSGNENNTSQKNDNRLFKNLDITAQKSTAQTAYSASLWKCPECGEENDKYSLFCTKCGKHK